MCQIQYTIRQIDLTGTFYPSVSPIPFMIYVSCLIGGVPRPAGERRISTLGTYITTYIIPVTLYVDSYDSYTLGLYYISAAIILSYLVLSYHIVNPAC